MGEDGLELYAYVYSEVLAHGGPVLLNGAGRPPGIACEPLLAVLFTGLAERVLVGINGVVERELATLPSNIAMSSPADLRDQEPVMLLPPLLVEYGSDSPLRSLRDRVCDVFRDVIEPEESSVVYMPRDSWGYRNEEDVSESVSSTGDDRSVRESSSSACDMSSSISVPSSSR